MGLLDKFGKCQQVNTEPDDDDCVFCSGDMNTPGAFIRLDCRTEQSACQNNIFHKSCFQKMLETEGVGEYTAQHCPCCRQKWSEKSTIWKSASVARVDQIRLQHKKELNKQKAQFEQKLAQLQTQLADMTA